MSILPVSMLQSTSPASGNYVLISLDGLGSNMGKSPSLSEKNGFVFSRDSWPMSNSGGGAGDPSFNGWCWGMAAGAQYFCSKGRQHFNSTGLITHLGQPGSDMTWAFSVASYLQGNISSSWLHTILNLAQLPWDPDGSSGFAIVNRLEGARFATGGAPQIVCRWGLFRSNGHPGAHAVLYIGTDGNNAYFYNPNHPYGDTDPEGDFELLSVPIPMLPFWDLGVFLAPLSDYSLTPGLSDDICEFAFDPANRDFLMNYAYGQPPLHRIRFRTLDDPIDLTCIGEWWPPHPDFMFFEAGWEVSVGGSAVGRFNRPYGELTFTVPVSDLIGLSIYSQYIKRGTVFLPTYIQVQNPAGITQPCRWDPADISLEYIPQMQPVQAVLLPPKAVTASDGTSGDVDIAWQPPNAGVVPDGYNVYRAVSAAGPWTKLNVAPVIGLAYLDAQASIAGYWYAVASVRTNPASESGKSLADRGNAGGIQLSLLPPQNNGFDYLGGAATMPDPVTWQWPGSGAPPDGQPYPVLQFVVSELTDGSEVSNGDCDWYSDPPFIVSWTAPGVCTLNMLTHGYIYARQKTTGILSNQFFIGIYHWFDGSASQGLVHTGSEADFFLPFQWVAVDGSALSLSPNWTISQDDFPGLALACYGFSVGGYAGEPSVQLTWGVSQDFADCYVGIPNYGSAVWEFYPCPPDGKIMLTSQQFGSSVSPAGSFIAVPILTGTSAWSLDEIRIGPQ
jgi:hypothetical protein